MVSDPNKPFFGHTTKPGDTDESAKDTENGRLMYIEAETEET